MRCPNCRWDSMSYIQDEDNGWEYHYECYECGLKMKDGKCMCCGTKLLKDEDKD